MQDLRRANFRMSQKLLEAEFNKEYSKMFKELNFDIKQKLKKYADSDNKIRSQYLKQIQSELNNEFQAFNKRWNNQHKSLIRKATKQSIADMKDVYDKMGLSKYGKTIKWNRNLVDYFMTNKAVDGLVISKRLWQHTDSIKRQLFDRIQRNVLTGESAWETMLDIENIHKPHIRIPNYLKEQMNSMSLDEIHDTIDFYTVKKTNFINRRLVETEFERAYRNTTLREAQKKPYVVGIKWNVSVSHDPGKHNCNCYTNSIQDSFNLGKGVYPIEYYPIAPDHPFCNCYETEVLEDEIIDEALKELDNTKQINTLETNQDLTKQLQTDEDRIRNNDYETLNFYSKDGEVLFSKKGTHNQVSYTLEEIKNFEKVYAGTHNHPNNASFSIADLASAHVTACKKFRATSKLFEYEMTTVPRLRNRSFTDLVEIFKNEANSIDNEIFEKFREGYQRLINLGYSDEKAQALMNIGHSHLKIKKLAIKFGFTYKRWVR